MDLDKITLERLRMWTPEALKTFLSVRKKCGEGSFDELVARAFAACEESILVDEAAETSERTLLPQYAAKLTQDEVYPDPVTITEGWQPEETGRFLWPSVIIIDVVDYLKGGDIDSTDFVDRLMDQHKLGKTYRYYCGSSVGEVEYHPVCSSAKHCFLKTLVHPSIETVVDPSIETVVDPSIETVVHPFMETEVHPSMNIKPYQVWVMAAKKTATTPGGRIEAAYCSCPAGLLGCCNHVAGLLFKVEAVVKSGATEQESTEEDWVVPLDVKPGLWRDTFSPKDGLYGQQVSKKKGHRQRGDNQPLSPEQLQDAEQYARKLEEGLVKLAPNSVFAQMRKKINPRTGTGQIFGQL